MGLLTQNQQASIGSARHKFILALLVMSFLASMGGLIAQLVIVASGSTATNLYVPVTFNLTFTVVAFILFRRERDDLALLTITGTLLIAYLVAPIQSITLLLGVMCLVAGATFPSLREYLIVNVLVFGKLIVWLMDVVAENGFSPTPEGVALVIQTSTFLIITATVRYFIVSSEDTTLTARRSADLLRASAEIGQITATLLDLNQLFARAVELIRDRFAYYHVQIFLVDDNRENASLVASTGDIGQQLLQRGHRLPVGSQSVIGRVTQIGETVIARDTDRDPSHARNELLPNTRSELALPILDGERIIGALDVQSTRANAFDETDIQALQVMASQLATAIRNARLFEAQAASVQENKRLFLESETNLREIQRLNRQLTKVAWEGYLRDRPNTTGVSYSANGLRLGAAWTPQMIEAALRQRTVMVSQEERTIALPIVLRGEVIGALEITPGNEIRQDDTVEILQSITQRLAIGLDNARLFEEAQEATLQEQRINEVVNRYQAATTVDDLLQITLAELSQTLGAEQGAIRLGVTSTAPDDKTKSNGSNGSSPHTNHRSNGGSA